MSPAEAEPYIHVSKWFCAGVATYIVFIWSLKVNMLFFYRRVVSGELSRDDGRGLGLSSGRSFESIVLIGIFE